MTTTIPNTFETATLSSETPSTRESQARDEAAWEDIDDWGMEDWVEDPQSDPQLSSAEPTRVPSLRLYVMASAFLGLQFCWTLEFAVVTPYFSQTLNSSPELSHAVWILLPLSGLLVAPVAGALSDRCTLRLGRRRPFLITGFIATAIGAFLFAYARQFVHGNGYPVVRWLAVVGFGVMDFSMNWATWPMRALLGDLVPEEQQLEAQSAALFVSSLGEIAASVMVASVPSPLDHIELLFIIAISLAFFTYAVTIILCREVSMQSPKVSPSSIGGYKRVGARPSGPPVNPHSTIQTVLHAALEPPYTLLHVSAVFALGWLALFCAFPVFSSWLGTRILPGNAQADPGSFAYQEYQRGVRLYGKANTLKAVLCVLLAPVQPRFVAMTSESTVMATGYGIFAIALFIGSFTGNEILAIAIVAISAIPTVVQHTVPLGIIATAYPTVRGAMLGILNAFGVLGQATDTLYTGSLARKFGEEAVLRVGAIWAFITAFAAVALISDRVIRVNSTDGDR